jgi:oligosaccharide repeat unit polymerase
VVKAHGRAGCRPGPEAVTTILALAGVAGLAALSVPFGTPPAVTAAVLLCELVAAILVVSRFRLAAGDWFHPVAFPLGYITFALAAPLLYLVLAGEPLQVIPALVDATVVALFAVTIIGLAGGIGAGLAVWRPIKGKPAQALDHRRLRAIGRLLVVAALFPRGYLVVSHLGEPYGAGSVSFGAEHSLDTLAVFMLFAGVVLIVVANVQLRGRIATPLDLALFGSFAGLTLYYGGRGELIPPVVFAIWAQHTYVRRLRLRVVAAGVLAIVLVFQAVGGTRIGNSAYEGPRHVLERTLVAVGTPTYDSSETVLHVPDERGFEYGSTYGAALLRQLPGPIAVRLFGDPDDTGAYVFRRVIHFDDPNSGFGFSLPAEGYLNFGVPGALVAAFLLGLLLAYAYRRQANPATRPIHLLYPVVLAALPLALRSDALGQLKWVLYPMVIVAAAYWVSGARGRSSDRTAPEKGRGMRSAGSLTPLGIRRRSHAVLAAAMLVAVLGLAAAVSKRHLIDAPTARAAISNSTGIPLREGPVSWTRAANVLATYRGNTRDESLIVVVAGEPGDAAELAQSPRGAHSGTWALRRENVVVFYTRRRGGPDRASRIESVLTHTN